MALPIKTFRQVAATALLGVNLPTLPIKVVNLDGDGTVIEWEITRPRRGAETGEVRFVNLSSTLREAMYASWRQSLDKPEAAFQAQVATYMNQAHGDLEGARLLASYAAPFPYSYQISLSIGWENIPIQIYLGDVVDMKPSVRRGEDVVTICEVGDRAVEDAAFGGSFGAISISDLVLLLITQPAPVGLGKLPLGPDDAVLVLQRSADVGHVAYKNWALSGQSSADMLTGLLHLLGLEWRIHNTRVTVFDMDPFGGVPGPTQLISPATGLLQPVTIEDDGDIEFDALANPDVVPATQIVVQDSNGKPFGAPVHRVESMTFTGTTEGSSTMRVQARKAMLL